MTTATAKIPQKLFTDLDDRGTIAEVPNVVARVLGGHRVELTGPVAEMAYLGDFIWQTAQGWDPARELYSAAKLLEVAARFPHAPAEDAEDEAPEASADLDANGPAPAIHATDEADERTACGDVVTIETFRTSSGREVTCPECLAANSVDEAPETETGSATAAAIERVWDVVRSHHPELPPVLVTLSAQPRGDVAEHSHLWSVPEGGMPELAVSREHLSRGPEYVLTAVLHAAAHALNHARGVQDTSRRGAYHSMRYMHAAQEFGLRWPDGAEPHSTRGFADLELSESARVLYAEALAILGARRAAWQGQVPTAEKRGKTASRNRRPKARCGCQGAAPIWLSRTLLDAGTVACTACGEPYRTAE